MTDKRRVTYTSPVLAFEYPNDGEPIWPCHDCLPWHVEVIESEDDGVLIREWHAVDCPALAEQNADAPHED